MTRRQSTSGRRRRRNQTIPRQTVTLNAAELELELALVDKDVGVFQGTCGVSFYTWMSPHEFVFYSGERGGDALRRWVATFDFTPCEDEGATSMFLDSTWVST